MKLNQYIAKATGMSRREASEELKAGNVRVNERVAEFWEDIDTKHDIVFLGGKKIVLPQKTTTILLNKPTGYITTRDDNYDREIVMDLLPKNLQHLKPVGRLDADSEGLLILTDDGDKIYEWTHPKFKHEKEYTLILKNTITKELIEKFTKGIKLNEGNACADTVEKISNKELRVVIHQGWKRQLRRMVEKCGNEVAVLKRVRMGDITLGDLRPGEYKIYS
jgi:23S rRNA pseudouridine2605 synthase